MRGQMVETETLELALEVICLVPFDYRVFNFAYTTKVAVNLHNAIRVLVMPILVVVEDCLFCRNGQLGHKPLNT